MVHEASKVIAFLYKFDQNCSREYIRDQINWLLKRDRFTCIEGYQKVIVVVLRSTHGGRRKNDRFVISGFVHKRV